MFRLGTLLIYYDSKEMINSYSTAIFIDCLPILAMTTPVADVLSEAVPPAADTVPRGMPLAE